MSSEIEYFIEKYPYKTSKVSNFPELLKRDICAKYEDKSKKDDSYNDMDVDIKTENIDNENKNTYIRFKRTGIIILKGTIYVVFPCGYKYNKADPYYDVQVLLKLLNIIEEKISKNLYESVELEHEGNIESLVIASKIIEDYKESRYITTDHIIEGTNVKGKVNWKKTMKLKSQIANDEGMPIFTELVRRHKENNEDSLLKALHMYVVNKSIYSFGVLWGMKSNQDDDNIRIPVEKEYAINFLQSQKRITYNSRILRTINLIIDFIDCEEKDSNNNSFMSFSTKTFYTIWEFICKDLFRDEFSAMRSVMPKPYWEINGENKYTKQIPDIVYKDKSELYILDAKYYCLENSLPGWHDLVKQYFYEMSLRDLIKDVKARYNVMLISSDIEETIGFLGISKVEGIIEFGQVGGILVNTKKAIKNYCYGNNEDYRNLLNIIVKRMNLDNIKYVEVNSKSINRL